MNEIAKTVDDTVALLQVNERTSEDRDDHDVPEFGSPTPWIGYRSPKSKTRLEELTEAGVEAGQFYLYDMGYIAPKPFYIHLIASFHFYSAVDDDNNILGASAILTPELKKEGYADHLIGLALVRIGGQTPLFKAATISQRKAMTRAFDDIRSAVASFEKDRSGREWKAKGAKHAAAYDAALAPPGGWPTFAVRAKIRGREEPSSKPGGRPFNLGLASIEPTPVEDVAALKRYAGFASESYGGENKKATDFANALKTYGVRRAEYLKRIDDQEKAQAG